MGRQIRELIGRAAMGLMALLLLVAAAALLGTGWRVYEDESAARAEVRRTRSSQRTTQYNVCFFVGGGMLAWGGLYFAKLALLSHRRLDEHPPKPPVLWENPEPGPRHWRGP